MVYDMRVHDKKVRWASSVSSTANTSLPQSTITVTLSASMPSRRRTCKIVPAKKSRFHTKAAFLIGIMLDEESSHYVKGA